MSVSLAGRPQRRMTRKRRRLIVLLVCGVCLGTAAALMLSAFSSDMVFFVAPSQIATKAPIGRSFRLGGLVQAGSLKHFMQDGQPAVRFRVTDGAASVGVVYIGILPDLFREGQGVVTLGKLGPGGVFDASEVLAKHDETYMPKDVEEALKRTGHWNPAMGPPPPAATWDNMNVSAKAAASPVAAAAKVGG
jgi:cytochrome c-type biogenesis protein CcmE